MGNFKIATISKQSSDVIQVSIKPVEIQTQDIKEFSILFVNYLHSINEKVTVIFDGSHAKTMNGDVRLMIDNLLNEFKVYYKSKIKATGIVTNSARTQAVLMTLTMLLHNDMSISIFCRPEDARTWVARQPQNKIAA